MKNLFLIISIIFGVNSFTFSQEKKDCTDWDYYKTECLSNVKDGKGSSEAGIRRRVCKISETTTSITVEAIIEPVNGGIDSGVAFYKGVNIFFKGKDRINLSKKEFNNGGTLKRTITLNKVKMNSDYKRILNRWNKRTAMLFVSAYCINN